jgi:tRNA-2-methylthio-N6-dimethylallyladenosine synthase
MSTEPTTKDPYANDGGKNAMPRTGRPGKRVFIETYGCQMNLADSELMGGILGTRGYEAASSLETADVILINTCAVREKAEERVYGRLSHLLRFKNENPDLVLGVTWCMAEHLRESIVERAPYVDLVAGPDSYRRLPDMLEKAQGDNVDPQIDVKLDKTENYEGLAIQRTEGINAWLSIQRGCDKFCTFCIVPFTRGRERGVSPDEIVRQARDIADRGFKEVTLLGQTVNSYVWEDWDFSDLLESLVEVEGLERIRFTSPYPTDFTPKLLETMARHKKLSNYIHVPAQSGSDDVLEVMKRQYTRAEYDQLIADIRETNPGIAISTDIIVGFPGETEEDFEKTCELLETVRYDFGYLFKYSERDGTLASRKIPDTVPEAVKKERLSKVIELQERISGEIFRSRIGTTQTVLVVGESRRDDAQLCGRSDDFKMTVFDWANDGSIVPGDLVTVAITAATSHPLIGHVVD